MTLRTAVVRLSPLAAALALSVTLAGCSVGSSVITSKTQGYSIPADAVRQIRPGSSQDMVNLVLGSPQTTNTFGNETVWYYVETKVSQTSFGLTNVQERTVLAVYFDKNKKVLDRAVYGLKDGKAVDIEQRRTSSYGEDRTFIAAILASI